ncbi:hypothetical protein CPC08DRAFT_695552 [Agrocybe pediades]|nr:hypothetical protein CPC08DRAFT_695552 [Agrocybe pediades]
MQHCEKLDDSLLFPEPSNGDTQSSRQSSDWQMEIVIPVVGIDGAGKSTFVKYLQQHELPVNFTMGHRLVYFTATARLRGIPLTFPKDDLLKHYTIILVEVPVSEGIGQRDTAVLRPMADQSGKAYHCVRVLGGIIYLHNISSERLSERERRGFEKFKLMCAAADVDLSMVIFGTTKWGCIEKTLGRHYEDELEAVHWNFFLEKGARTKRFEDSYESALSFIKDLVMKLISVSQSPTPDSKPEVIIPVMGITGAGKSTFVNYLVQNEALKTPVGHGLASCTAELHPIPLTLPKNDRLKDHRIILVDTPGFDDTYLGDTAILRLIANWLAKAYRDKKVLGGIIFLHDVSSRRVSPTEWRTIDLLNLMCGEAALGKVVFGTTNWTRTTEEKGQQREQELRDVHWKLALEMGAQYQRFEDSYESAVSFIEMAIRKDHLLNVNLKIQTEIVDEGKIVSETQTGQRLLWSEQEVLAMQMQMQQELAYLAIAKAGSPEAAAANQRYEEASRKIDDLILQIQGPKVLQLVHRLKNSVTS